MAGSGKMGTRAGSPRRRALLASAGVVVTVVATGFGVHGWTRGGDADPLRAPGPCDATCVTATSTAPHASAVDGVSASREEESTALVSKESAARQLAGMPVVFVKNDGQWPTDVKFGAHGHGVAVAFTERGMTLSAPAHDAEGREWVQAVAFDFFGTRDGREPQGERKLSGVHNYFVGNDSSKWRTSVPLFEAVRYDAVAPGIAMVVTDRAGQFEYDLQVEPGADLAQVDITCRSADAVSLDADGSLRLETKAGVARQAPPKAWYEQTSGQTKVADCRFRVTGPTSYGFEVLNPDPASKLNVDPTIGLTWSTFLGASGDDAIYGVDFLSGKVTVAGTTGGTGFPTSTGAFDTSQNGGQDAFVTRLDPSLSGSSQLVWSTYLGGSSDESALSLDLTSTGKVAVCGKTTSNDFPTTSGAFAGSIVSSGVTNCFVCLLNSSGTGLDYSTYYGSTNGKTRANSVKIDSTPNITIVGYVEGSGLQITSTAYDTTYDGGPGDAFVAQFDPTASGSASLTYGSYIGSGFGGFSASSYDEAFAVALEGGKVYIAGTTASTGFHTQALTPYTVIFDSTYNGRTDCFLMKLNTALTGSNQLRYATFVGGEDNDGAQGLVVYQDVFHSCGYTQGSGYPTGTVENSNGVYKASKSGTDLDAFLTKLDPNWNTPTDQLRYSTLLGGTSDEIAYSVGRVQDKADMIVGYTESSNFPTADFSGGGAYDITLGGTRDAFFTRFVWAANRSAANQLDYSSFFGGTSSDEARSIVIDGTVEAYFGGSTLSNTGFPTTGSPYDSSYNGGSSTGDGFASWFTMPPVAL